VFGTNGHQTSISQYIRPNYLSAYQNQMGAKITLLIIFIKSVKNMKYSTISTILYNFVLYNHDIFKT